MTDLDSHPRRCGMEGVAGGSLADWSYVSIHVAHFAAQNARNQTDTDLPDRHTSLNPRALAVQTDVLDRFLCFDSPQLHKTGALRGRR